jgi:hypothetical protein
MKEFKDLEFVSMSDDFFGVDGVRARIDFPNGFGASVVRHNYSYGGPDGLYELGVTKDGELHYDNSVAEGDVQGYLDEEGVTELLKGIQLL